MSTLQTIVNTYNEVSRQLPDGSLGAGPIKAVSGRITPHGVLDRQALQTCLDRFKAAGGWLQYQSRVVRPQQFESSGTVPVEHPDGGLLLDAELFRPGDQPASLVVRFTGEGWLATKWQAGEGESFLAETVQRRGLGGIRMSYLRLWQEKDHELQAVSAWLIDTRPANHGDSND